MYREPIVHPSIRQTGYLFIALGLIIGCILKHLFKAIRFLWRKARGYGSKKTQRI